MLLSEVFEQLTYGELSQLAIGGAEAGAIQEKNYSAIIASINLGLTALYKRFPLKEDTFQVQLQANKLTYPLAKAYALSNTASTEPVKYILDTESPFIGNIHKVERVYADTGYELKLNDHDDEYSLFTPSVNVIKVPAAIVAKNFDLPELLKTDKLSVVFRANHPIIPTGDDVPDPTEYELELPYSHLEPLLLFVASRLHNPLGMNPNTPVHTGNNYAAKYEAACQLLEKFNLRVDQGSQPDRLTQNGWV